MQLMAFSSDGAPGWGVVEGEQVAVLSGLLPYADLGALLEADGLDAARAALPGAPRVPLAGVVPAAPLPRARIFCIGLNYPKPHPLGGQVESPPHISFFLKQHEALVPHGAALRHPEISQKFDYECELAVVIGRPGHRIPRDRALDHVAGYTVLNDGSVRDWQAHSVTAGKNFWASGSWGPVLTTADVVGDPAALRLQSWLNGKLVQDSLVGAMFFDVPAIIAYLSSITPLRPGDVIATGSPEGTGATQSPPRFLHRGDRLAFAVERVGRLENHVA
jgi:2-keto-4-pentenoate hydratase/2-oxohepta-3-ene-1,7-dioic acid hydratase in catechol pathway